MNEMFGRPRIFLIPVLATLLVLHGCGDGGGGGDADADTPDAPVEEADEADDAQHEENPGDPPLEDVFPEGDCTPSCAGRECGLDPVCGTQSCGTCEPGDVCNDSTGQCEPPAPESRYSTLYIWRPDALLDDAAHVREQLWIIVGELGLTDLLVKCYELAPMDREDAWVGFMTDAHARGVRIWCELPGNYPWESFLPGHERSVKSVLAFNRLHPTLTFQGFALDIEYVGGSYQERYEWLHETYFPTMKGWSNDGETLVDQGLRIYFYDDSQVPSPVTQAAWEDVAGDVDMMELQSYGGTAEAIIAKAEGGGTSRAVLCDELGKDYTIVVELNRYDTFHGDHALGWTDEPAVQTILDTVHAHFDGLPHYRGLCLHADRGVALRHLVHSMSADGSNLQLDLIWAMGSGVPEELRIEAVGMTSRTFTPEPNVLYPLIFSDYQPDSAVDIIATRVLDGHGPTLVMSFVP